MQILEKRWMWRESETGPMYRLDLCRIEDRVSPTPIDVREGTSWSPMPMPEGPRGWGYGVSDRFAFYDARPYLFTDEDLDALLSPDGTVTPRRHGDSGLQRVPCPFPDHGSDEDYADTAPSPSPASIPTEAPPLRRF